MNSGFPVLDFPLFSTFCDGLSHGHFGGIGRSDEAGRVPAESRCRTRWPFKYRFSEQTWMAVIAYNLLCPVRGIPCLYYGEAAARP